MLVIVIPILFPLYFVLISSFKNMAQVYIMPPKLFGFKPILDNYIYIFKTQHYGTYMMNSTIVAVASTALSLLLGVPAAYAIARYKMGKANTAILTARLLPNISILLPYYFIFSSCAYRYLRCADSQPHGAVPSADCVDYGGIFQ